MDALATTEAINPNYRKRHRGGFAYKSGYIISEGAFTLVVVQLGSQRLARCCHERKIKTVAV